MTVSVVPKDDISAVVIGNTTNANVSTTDILFTSTDDRYDNDGELLNFYVSQPLRRDLHHGYGHRSLGDVDGRLSSSLFHTGRDP